jgi:hypothetical protein
MVTWKAFSMFATLPLSLRSLSSRVPLMISKPLAFAKATRASQSSWLGPNLAVNSCGVRNLW